MKSIKDFNVKNKRILIRCDFNVPLDDKGDILDNFKIKETLPTIRYLISARAKLILMSHLGDPGGKVVENLKLNKVKMEIEDLLGVSIKKVDDCIGPEVEDQVSILKQGEILLLENLRFYKEETDNNLEFAQKLSQFGDIFINDAFAECHRNYASIIGIPKFLPHGAGLLLEKEVKNLAKVLENPKRPFVVVIGGEKAETKVKFIEKISEISDLVIVSGLIQKEIIAENMKFKNQEKIIGPVDDLDIFDISNKIIELFCAKILTAKTIIWNGPFGKIEDNKFRIGTLKIATTIIKSGAFSVVGGGSTVEFLNQEGLISEFSHVSTGGGAMLDFLSGEELPGLKALEG